MSEEVAGFCAIPANKKIRLTKGVYSGLGQILVLAVFLHEIDLNLGNLGVNADNAIIKIDGDWSFASIVRPDLFADKPSAITKELLQSLPKLFGYFAYNWLDICQLGREENQSDLFAEDLQMSPHFRFEMHQAILFVLLLSPAYLKKLIDGYVPENSDAVLEFLLSRQAQLKMSAMNDPQFVAFLSSIQVNGMGGDYLLQMGNFTIQGNAFIQSSEIEALKRHGYLVIESLQVNSSYFSPRLVSDDSITNTDIDENSISPAFSFVSIDNPYRLFTPSPANFRSTSSGTLKFNRTCSNLSQLSEGSGSNRNPLPQVGCSPR